MPKLASLILSRCIRESKSLFGVESYLRNEDRRILEQIIIPYYLNENEYQNVLSVGCHWYTKGYNNWFEKLNRNLYTLDIDPSRKRYGAKKHIIGAFQNMGSHFKPTSLDLILCNGVFGWGLDDHSEVEQAFQACFDSLRVGGQLVIGWDDNAEHRPFPLEQCESLGKFKPALFPPLGSTNFVTETPYHHVYSFFTKPAAPIETQRMSETF